MLNDDLLYMVTVLDECDRVPHTFPRKINESPNLNLVCKFYVL